MLNSACSFGLGKEGRQPGLLVKQRWRLNTQHMWKGKRRGLWVRGWRKGKPFPGHRHTLWYLTTTPSPLHIARTILCNISSLKKGKLTVTVQLYYSCVGVKFQVLLGSSRCLVLCLDNWLNTWQYVVLISCCFQSLQPRTVFYVPFLEISPAHKDCRFSSKFLLSYRLSTALV